MGFALVFWLAGLQQIAIPEPRGFVNDFAGVLDAAAVSHMEAVAAEVREKTRGEIAVVTFADIGDRQASDVAVLIGRRWGVGAAGEAGDPAKNLGIVVLLVPRKEHRPGSGALFIATGRGAEGFLPDSRVGRIRDAMGPSLAQEDYGAGLALGVDLIAGAFAEQFGVTLNGPGAPAPSEEPVGAVPLPGLVKLLLVLAVLILLSRRRSWLPWLILSSATRRGGWGRGGGGSWGGGSGGGGFGGGFGGFGGGGGFSGGGAGGKF